MGQFPGAFVLIEDEAEIVYRKGRFYVTDAAGQRVVERHIFLKNFRNAAKAIQESFGAEGAEVVQFPAAHG